MLFRSLRSVSKGIERAGGRPIVSERFEDFAHATHLILPGVGAFRDAIRELRQRDLVPRIRDWIAADRPFLGICLGLQLLLDVSFEGGEYEGLGIIPGQVVRFQFDKASGGDFGKKSEELTYKVPHMGWNQVNLANKTSQQVPEESMLRGLPTSPYFYFVHSYHAVPKHAEDAWLTS
mgnify:CR=1 FL=1